MTITTKQPSERLARQKLIELRLPQFLLNEIESDPGLTYFGVVRLIEQQADLRNLNQSYAVELLTRRHRGSGNRKLPIQELFDDIRTS